MVSVKVSVRNLSVSFGKINPLHNVSIDIDANEILSIIGPANSGKTTFLKTLNRLNDGEEGLRMDGRVLMDGRDIYRQIDPVELRRKVGIIFALPIPLPMSVFENVVYGLRRQNIRDKKVLSESVEHS